MGWYGENKYQRTWRPVSIADANRYSVSWSRRNDARDKLDDLSFEHQKTAAESALGRNVRDSELKTRPQRGPLHTQSPAFPAARACLGLSAISEFKAHAGRANAILQAAVKLAPETLSGLDPNAAAQTSAFVLEAVANRLCIDQLYRVEGLGAVESYRLFAAAMIDLRFTRLKDVILAATTLGDLVFGLVKREPIRRRMHPLTCRILDAMAPACQRYQISTADCDSEQLPMIGDEFAKELMAALVPFLPLKQTPQPDKPALPDKIARELLQATGGPKRVPLRKRSQAAPTEDVLSQPLAGADDPVPPSIDQSAPWRLKPHLQKPEPQKPTTGKNDCCHCGTQNPPANTFCTQCGKRICEDAMPLPSEDAKTEVPLRPAQKPDKTDGRLQPPGPRSPEELQVQAVLQRAVSMIAQATGRSQWDDPRVDQVAQALRDTLYAPGAVEAELATRRHKVTAYGSGREGGIHEEALSRCRDEQALRQIQQGAAPIEKKLRGYQWFGQRQEAMVDRFQTRGALDPRRLHRIAASSLLRRKWRRRNVTDYRGKPVVVLAKDGSSSNTIQTTFAGKILASAFLRIERLARIRMFAADYSSDRGGPLVRWLYHPQKTPGRSSLQAADAVASLPPKGQGGNEDVLSMSHIMHEVLNSPSAGKQTVIVINVTDGKFNSPIDEFRSMIRKLREEYRLTYSLVILGDAPVNVPEADHVVRIPKTELQEPHQIAERIAKHVNTLVRGLRGKKRPTHV